MNYFVQMLLTEVSTDWKPEGKRGGNPKPDPERASAARSAYAFAKYKEVMGKEWVRTPVVQKRLGYSAGTVGATLTAFWEKGLVERRPYGGGKFNHRHGWEWRML